MKKKKQRVVIVDDHPMFRERLSQLINLDLDMEVCGEADDAEEGIRIIRDTSPNLAIVDISLNASSGLELVRSINRFSASIPILVLSMHDESLYARRALQAGASGYVTKLQPAEEVLSAIRCVLAGKVYLSQQATCSLLKNLSTGGANGFVRPLGRLSNRELQVLEYIGSGYTTRAIAEALKVEVATIETYRGRIKEKMEFRSTGELQHFAVRWMHDRE